MGKILKSNSLLLFLFVLLLGYFIYFISIDVVANETLYNEYLTEKFEKKYKEYKDVDIELEEFKDELEEFEQKTINESWGYSWDDFYIDSIHVLLPLIVVVLGFTCILLTLFLFHKLLNQITFLSILNSTVLAYMVFYVPDIIASIYFLIFNRDYKFQDIGKFENNFRLSQFFDKEVLPSWLYTAISDFQLIYILYPLLVAFFIKFLYKSYSFRLLVAYVYVAYFVSFILMELILWYLFGF